MSMFKKNAVEQKTLTKGVMEHLLENKNARNRQFNVVACDKYKKMIAKGEWDFDFLEGKLIVIDYMTGDLLSGQHRLRAMLDSGIDKLSVFVNYVDRDQWLKRSHEKRSAADIINMSVEVEIPKELGNAMAVAAGQYDKIRFEERPHTNSGNIKRPDPMETAKMFGNAAKDFWSKIPNTLKRSKSDMTALLSLYLAGKVDLDTIVSDFHRPDTRLGSARHWLVDVFGYGGVGRSSVIYGIVVYHHALNTKINEDYCKINDNEKPVYAGNKMHFTFADYE